MRLDPPIPLQTPCGEAVAHIYCDGGLESESFWVCFCRDGAIMEFANGEVRACRNLTVGRDKPDRPASRKPLFILPKKTRKIHKQQRGPRIIAEANGVDAKNFFRDH
jgi:hypothetical protein